MRVLNGRGSSGGVAVGDIYYMKKHDLTVVESKIDDIPAEIERFNHSKLEAITQLDKLYEHAVKTDFSTAQVFEVHKMLIDDPDFSDGCLGMIEEGFNAEWAVVSVRTMIADMFLAMDDPYMRARSADIMDISDRILKILKGIKETDLSLTGKLIVVAEDLLPSETVKLDKNNVVGFVTKFGSNTSHSAILARTMGIPAVVNLRESFSDIPLDGKIAIDGDTGKVIVDPTSVIIANYQEMIKRQNADKQELKKYVGSKAITKHGHGVKIGANIGSVTDIAEVKKNDADCVGLFRSEFVYLESDHFPTEEEQFKIYKQVVSELSPLNVIIRTLD
ncbi:MAG: phosphoenolpyruvate-utilizing N-terminal domain-containing protein, partial [Clostridia bacterium]